MLTERIGKPAMLEQTAEECAELAQACLKLARFMRGENAVYKSEQELVGNLVEEITDVKICLNELIDYTNIFTRVELISEYEQKMDRMRNRLSTEVV